MRASSVEAYRIGCQALGDLWYGSGKICAEHNPANQTQAITTSRQTAGNLISAASQSEASCHPTRALLTLDCGIVEGGRRGMIAGGKHALIRGLYLAPTSDHISLKPFYSPITSRIQFQAAWLI